MANLYTIISIQGSTATDSYGRIQRTVLVKYMVGPDGPFTLTVPPDQNTPPQIAQLLTQAAQNIKAIRG